jgi:hypothetical protein
MFEGLIIAETFRKALSALNEAERKATFSTVMEVQLNPKSQGADLHRIEKARDANLWSVRASRDIRIVLYRKDGLTVWLYVDHHDAAYNWARHRQVKFDPKTGAAQVINFVEKEVVIPVQVTKEVVRPHQAVETPAKPPAKKPFIAFSDDQLAECRVPEEMYPQVRDATEDEAFLIGLPEEALDNLLDLLCGRLPAVLRASDLPDATLPVAAPESPPEAHPEAPGAVAVALQPFVHPDAQRRFTQVETEEQLKALLLGPWDKWQTFLHPDQREIAEASYAGPARVSGSAGTGKSIVALHRVNFLLRRNDEARVLLCTISPALSGFLHAGVRRLLADKPRLGERVDVTSIDDYAVRLHELHVGPVRRADSKFAAECLRTVMAERAGTKFHHSFVESEWQHVVDPMFIRTEAEYLAAERLGRKSRLSPDQRKALWEIFARVIEMHRLAGVITTNEVYHHLLPALAKLPRKLFDHIVVDEAQDLSIGQIRFLAAIGGNGPDGLFFAGDIGQRIFQQPFSWKTLGVDIADRSYVLRVNYRTSQQIRVKADRLLDSVVTDADGNQEDRSRTISVVMGKEPELREFISEQDEIKAVGEWIKHTCDGDIRPSEVGVFVRGTGQMERAQAAVKESGYPCVILDDKLTSNFGSVNVATMHLAKGMEFRAVAVMACDDQVIPSSERISLVGDAGDLKEAYETERHLLYVACTRARDRLWISGVTPTSEFLSDMS